MSINPNLLTYNPYYDPDYDLDRDEQLLAQPEVKAEGTFGSSGLPVQELRYHNELMLLVGDNGDRDEIHLEPRLKVGQHIGRVAMSRGKKRLKTRKAITSTDFPNARLGLMGQPPGGAREVELKGQVFAAKHPEDSSRAVLIIVNNPQTPSET